MRGLPPLQALLLLVALAVLGAAGRGFIDTGETVSEVAPPPTTCDDHETVEAEIKFIFSSPPDSYTLTQPSVTGEADQVLLNKPRPTENPCYEIVNLLVHQPGSYWLDVVWPEDSLDGAHHFVQVYISPIHGQSESFSFYSNSKSMNETFEYDGGEHHDHE